MSKLPVIARVVVVSSLLTLLAAPAWGWGSDGHRMINRLGAQYLPDSVPYFLRNGNGLDVMDYLGPEPDRWRDRDAEPELVATQAPDHFLNLEIAELAATPCTTGPDCVGGFDFPRKRYDYIRALALAQAKHQDLTLTPERVGMQPWQVEEVWERLKVDFREYRKLVAANQDTAPDQVALLYDCAWLGHYVGDGSQPLHVTVQYNGWTGPNPHGYTTDHHIHSKFESVYVSANITPGDVAPLVAATQPKLIADEWTDYFAYIDHTNSLVEKVYQLDQEHGFDGAGTPAAKAFTEERLAAGAIELRNLIYSAWVHSADPVQEYHGPQ